jgi:hypothetical protein
MFLAGIGVTTKQVLELARFLVDDEELAMRLKRAVVEGDTMIALETEERQSIVQALGDPPPAGFEVLRSTLLQESERRRAGGH